MVEGTHPDQDLQNGPSGKGTMSGSNTKSVAVWDLAPEHGGAPCDFQVIEARAEEMMATWPGRYRFVLPGEPPPSARSDGKPVAVLDGDDT